MADMTYRPLGDSGLTVSAVGVGCNAFGRRIDADQTTAVVHAALDQGITMFDTADAYGRGESELLLGRALGAQRATWSSPPSSAWTCRARTGRTGACAVHGATSA